MACPSVVTKDSLKHCHFRLRWYPATYHILGPGWWKPDGVISPKTQKEARCCPRASGSPSWEVPQLCQSADHHERQEGLGRVLLQHSSAKSSPNNNEVHSCDLCSWRVRIFIRHLRLEEVGLPLSVANRGSTGPRCHHKPDSNWRRPVWNGRRQELLTVYG